MHTSIFNLIGLYNSMRFLNVALSLKLTIKYGNERFSHLDKDAKSNRFIQNLLQNDRRSGKKAAYLPSECIHWARLARIVLRIFAKMLSYVTGHCVLIWHLPPYFYGSAVRDS